MKERGVLGNITVEQDEKLGKVRIANKVLVKPKEMLNYSLDVSLWL